MSFLDSFRLFGSTSQPVSSAKAANRTANTVAGPVESVARGAGDVIGNVASGVGSFIGGAADNIGRFFGGLAGDQRTKSGLAINDAGTPAKGQEIGTVRFTFLDNSGNKRQGLLYVPADTKDLNKNTKHNQGVVSIYGMDLDDGRSLNYQGALDFLNGNYQSLNDAAYGYNSGLSLEDSEPDTSNYNQKKIQNKWLSNFRNGMYKSSDYWK